MGLTRDYALNLEIKWNSIDGITNVPFLISPGKLPRELRWIF